MATKKQLIEKMAERAGISQKDAGNALGAFIEIVGEELKARNNVALVGFGTFSAVFTPKKEGIMPGTGKPYVSPEKHVPKFKAGKGLKDIVA